MSQKPQGVRNIFLAEPAELLTTPRDPALRPLLFSSLTNQNGLDSGIAIVNTSSDPLGTTNVSGSCAWNFFGDNAPASLITPSMPAGGSYVALLSVVAPNFK